MQTRLPINDSLITDRNWVPILANRIAGPRRLAGKVESLAQALHRRGMMPEIFEDRHEFRAALADADRVNRCRCQVAAGGDGTAAWAINSTADAPLAVLPLGNENLLARFAGVSRDPELLADAILHGRARRIDLGRVNDRFFALMASVGFDSDVIERLHASRNRHINMGSYFFRILQSGICYRYSPMKVRLDDDEWHEAAHVFVFNLPHYGLRIPICPTALPDDGLLDAVLFRRPGLLPMLNYLFSILRGRHMQRNDVLCRRVGSIDIHGARPALVQSDGDPSAPLPVRITVVRSAMSLVVAG